MIIQENWEVKTNSESEDEHMPPLEDASDVDGEERIINGEPIVVMQSLNFHIKKDDLDQHRTRIFHTRCDVYNKVCNLINRWEDVYQYS